MDRSLDEIAAEMDSPRQHEREYGEGGDGGGPHRGHYRSYRYSPYSTGHGRSEPPKKETEECGKRLFVANLSFNVTWQRLKDYMRQGTLVPRLPQKSEYEIDLNPLQPIINSLKKQKTQYKVLTPSINNYGLMGAHDAYMRHWLVKG